MGNFGRSLGLPSPLKPTALTGTEAAQGVQFGTTSSCFSHVTPRKRLPRSPKLPALWPDRVAERVEGEVGDNRQGTNRSQGVGLIGVGLRELPYSKDPEVLPALPRITLPGPTATVATLWKKQSARTREFCKSNAIHSLLRLFLSELPYSHPRTPVDMEETREVCINQPAEERTENSTWA